MSSPPPSKSSGPPGKQRSEGSYWSGFDVLWGLTAPPPVRRTMLDRAGVVQAAIALADTDGLAAVTMRRVADRLEVGPMSLYRHVPDKDALVSMMVDSVIEASLAASETEPMPEHWRDGLRLVAASTWELARRHPWFPEASMVRPPLTPAGAAGLELALSIFDQVDIDFNMKMLFIGAVHFSVIASALNSSIEERAMARLHMSEAQVQAAGTPFIREIIASGKFPRVSAFIVGANQTTEADQMWASVELVLDGIESRLQRAAAASG